LPSIIEIKEAKDNRAQIVIEPCYPGFGVTLGNSLRRVLLSSIQGAAINAFKVSGVQHEFSTLPGVKEDLIEIILNLKRVRVKSYSAEPVILKLQAKGAKEVKAKDIEKDSNVEIVSPEQVILTLTDAKASIDMELFVDKGYGYVTVEDREKEKVDIGTIIIDAIYSPLVSVGFDIENMRVGEQTNYERLILKIETDGSITPKEALERASVLLVDHFSVLLGENIEKSKKSKKEAIAEGAEEKDAEVVLEAGAEEKDAEVEEKPKKKRGRPKKADK